MVKKVIFVIIIFVVLYSCQETNDGEYFTITGNLKAHSGQKLLLKELEPLKSVNIDSVIVGSEGNFNFDVKINEAGFFLLQSSGCNIILQVEPAENIIVICEHEKSSDGYSIDGSPGSELLMDFENFMSLQKKRLDSLSFVYSNARGSDNFMKIKNETDSLYMEYIKNQRAYVFDFLEREGGSLSALLVINRKLGNINVIDEMDDFIYLHFVDSLLQINYPGNKHMLDHKNRVEELRGKIFDQYVIEEKLSPGKKAPDIILKDTVGDPVSLKMYYGQKVIVYFWAAWDAKSRRDNLKLRKLYPGLKDKNIEILGVSFDENEIVWKGAIKLDQLSWPQVSDPAGFYSELKKKYNIPDKLPFYYLIDEKQKIISKSENLDDIHTLLQE